MSRAVESSPAPRRFGSALRCRWAATTVALLLTAGLPTPATAATPEEAGDGGQRDGSFELPCRGVSLRDVSRQAGLTFQHDRGARGAKHLPETMGSGVAWLDFDGDGWWDLYFVQSGPFPPDGSDAAANRLYRNLGDGRFEDWTERSGAGDRAYGQGALAADLDGDGATDLFLTAYGTARNGDRFLRNRGDGSFEDRTAGSGLDEAPGWSSSAAAGDADGDGDLEIYVARYLRYDLAEELYCGDLDAGRREYCDPTLFENHRDLYFENLGDGRFRERLGEAGLAIGEPGKGLGVIFTDLDDDGRPDLYVANDLTLNLLFANLGDGTFEDLSLLSGAAVNAEGKAEAGMGLAVGDLNGDDLPEIGVTNFDVETNTLYRNLGLLQFEDDSARGGFGPASFNLLGFGLVFADLNQDGHLDAWAANGHIFEQPRRDNTGYAQPDLLLLGNGSGGFAAQPCGILADGPAVGRGLAVGDPDNDGDPDLAVLQSDGPGTLLANQAAPGRSREAAGGSASWLGIDLRGAGTNTQAIGAKLVLTLDGQRQSRWVSAGDSYQSTSDKRARFAWRDGEAEALDITWPSGRRLRLVEPPKGRYLVVREMGEADGAASGLGEETAQPSEPDAGSAPPSQDG